jgi:hypothetical protein
MDGITEAPAIATDETVAPATEPVKGFDLSIFGLDNEGNPLPPVDDSVSEVAPEVVAETPAIPPVAEPVPTPAAPDIEAIIAATLQRMLPAAPVAPAPVAPTPEQPRVEDHPAYKAKYASLIKAGFDEEVAKEWAESDTNVLLEVERRAEDRVTQTMTQAETRRVQSFADREYRSLREDPSFAQVVDNNRLLQGMLEQDYALGRDMEGPAAVYDAFKQQVATAAKALGLIKEPLAITLPGSPAPPPQPENQPNVASTQPSKRFQDWFAAYRRDNGRDPSDHTVAVMKQIMSQTGND